MEKIEKTLEEWRAMLDPEQFNVCRLSATERPFSGKYNATKTDGVYHCICCNTTLYDSKTKSNPASQSGKEWCDPASQCSIAPPSAMPSPLPSIDPP